MSISGQTFSCAGFKKISLRKQNSVNQSYFLPEDEQTKYQTHFVVSPQDQSIELATSSVAIEDVPVMIGTVRVDDDDAHDVKDDNDVDDDKEEEEVERMCRTPYMRYGNTGSRRERRDCDKSTHCW